jgi:hypothetical protein
MGHPPEDISSFTSTRESAIGSGGRLQKSRAFLRSINKCMLQEGQSSARDAGYCAAERAKNHSGPRPMAEGPLVRRLFVS